MLHAVKQTAPGFTLVELLVSMGIGLVVLAAVTSTFITQSKVYNVQEQVNEMQQTARAALDIMAREIRMAGYKPNGGSVVGVTYDTSQLRIQADLDGSGSVSAASDEDVTYRFVSGDLAIERNSVVLAESIQDFTFDYLDANGASTTTTANIRQVKVTVKARTAKSDPNYSANGGYRTYEVSSDITPPNLSY